MEPSPKVHEFHVQKKYFDSIQNGTKTVEGRTADPQKREIKMGHVIRFFYDKENPKVTCDRVVTEIIETFTFREMLKAVGITNALPGVQRLDEAEEIYLGIPGYREKEKEFGVLGFRLGLTEDDSLANLKSE